MTWTIPRPPEAGRQWPGRERRTVRTAYHRLVLASALLSGLVLGGGSAAAGPIKLSPDLEFMYSQVEMEPPSTTHMTVCYGFVCRLRLTLLFTAAERTTITNLMNKGRANAAEHTALRRAAAKLDDRAGQLNQRKAAIDDPGLKPPLRLRWVSRGYGHFLTPAVAAGEDVVTISLNEVITAALTILPVICVGV